jgi:hypothetical protein
MAIYTFGIGQDVRVLRELIAKYIALVFLRTQGFTIIYPILENSRYLWTALATTHIVAEKGRQRFAIGVKYGKEAKLDETERVTVLQLRKAGCTPIFLRVFGDVNGDKWQLHWTPL